MPLTRARAQASASRSVSLVILMILSVFSSMPIASANPTSGTIESFSDGSSSITLNTDSQLGSSVNVTIQRNTTIDSASFHITYDTNDPSPGSMTVDLDSDGQYEWHLGGNGDGSIGEQTEFDNGATTTSVSANGNQTWLSAGGWRLPTSALLSSSEITVGFTPDLGAQFSGIGAVTDLAVGDMDGDGHEDAIYLVPDHVGTNGTIWPHIGWLKWSGSSIVTSWIPTCFDADGLILGDSDNDSQTDILVIASEEDTLCQHISGNSWAYSTNISMNEKFQDAVLADMDGDGQDDLVFIDADGTLGMRAFSGGSYTTAVTETVQSGNQMPGMENFVHIGVGSFYGTNQTIVIGEEDMMTSYNTLWNFSGNNWVGDMQEFECTSGPFEIFDWNGDGIHDLMGPSSTNACTATWNGTAWNTATSIVVGLTNYSIGDHDGDGTVSLFRAIEGTPDGSDSTQTGSLDMHAFENTGALNTTSTSFNPHTSPRDVVFADLDGDGLPEQIVAAGEATPGLFIGAWHSLEWDLESDSTLEMSMEGYASTSNPLTQSDQGLLITNVAAELVSTTVTYDAYDTPWGLMNPVARSMGAGTISQSGLNMSYTATFVVETNPTNGNLSNVMNGFMLMGTGDIDIPMNVTCTRNGTVTLDSLSIAWIAGASNIEIPEPPTLTVFNFTYNQVSLMWSNTTSPEDFVTYQVFRAPTGSQISINQPLVADHPYWGYQDSSPEITNQEWDYAVRSVHNHGIHSNLSNIVSVLVPDVPPVYDTTPPDAAIVALNDVPDDNGGVMNLSFTPSSSTDLEYTLVYFENSDFTNASGLTPYANISSDDPTTSMLITGLNDGEDYWAATVSVDGDDNAWWNVTAVGPVHSVNNTIRQSNLTLSVDGDGITSDGVDMFVHLHAGSHFEIEMQLSSEGSPLPNEDVSLSVTVGGSTWSTTVTTGQTGIAEQSWADWTDFVTQWEAHGGYGQVSASWAGGTFGTTGQSVAAASNSVDIVVTVDATFSTSTPSIQLDSEGTGTAFSTAISIDSAEQSLLDGIAVNWQLGNGTEILGESGMSQFDSNGATSIPIDYATGGWLDLTPSTPWWLNIAPATIRIDLLPSPLTGCTDPGANNYDANAEEDDGTCTYPNQQLTFVEVSCDATWEILDNSTQAMADIDSNSMHCLLTNNNPVAVFAAINFEGLSPLFSDDLSGSSIPIESGASLTFTLSPNAWSEGTTLSNGTVSVDVVLNTNEDGWDGVSDSWILPYIFTEAPDIPDDSQNQDDNSQGTEKNAEEDSNLMILILVVGVVLGILGFVGLRLAMREEEDEDAEDFEDEEWESKPKKRIKTQPDMEDMPSGRSLDELTTKGSSVSMSKPKRVNRRAGARPAPVHEVLEEEEEEEEETEWDYTQDEDYHVDDDGVEWWKDEVGQWWYKYPEDDDWEAFEE